jgi:hypothetical protein
MYVAALADLLHETSEHHDPYEKIHPNHNWWIGTFLVSAHARRGAPLKRQPQPRVSSRRNSEMTVPDNCATRWAPLRRTRRVKGGSL